MNYVKMLFTYVPYAVLALTAALFVFRLSVGWKGRTAWMVWLAFCCSKFLGFQKFGGNVFVPDLPELFIWFWNWAYSGAMVLSVLSVVCWFRFAHKGLTLAILAWSLSLWGLWCGVKAPDVREIELPFADLPAELDGYRIVHLTDLHASNAARAWRTRAVVERVNALNADLVCLTGDYADGHPGKCRDFLKPLADLRAKDGVYAVTGNHEWFAWQQGWRMLIPKLGIPLLANACVFPRKSLALAGVDDFRVQDPKSGRLLGDYPDVGRAFAAATNGEFRVLLQHQPRAAHANLSGHGVNLQLSGHTHGGIMPVLSWLVSYSNGGFVRGLYRFGEATLYVNPGCGQWPGFPMRFLVPSEIALITLRRTRP